MANGAKQLPNQCWLLISEVPWHSDQSNCPASYHSENSNFIFIFTSPSGQWVISCNGVSHTAGSSRNNERCFEGLLWHTHSNIQIFTSCSGRDKPWRTDCIPMAIKRHVWVGYGFSTPTTNAFVCCIVHLPMRYNIELHTNGDLYLILGLLVIKIVIRPLQANR